MLEWITDPNVMSVSDQIEEVNRKMFDKIRSRNDNLVVFFCKSLTFYYLLYIPKYFVTQKFAARIRPHFCICFSSFFQLPKKIANNVRLCYKNSKILMMKPKMQVIFLDCWKRTTTCTVIL